MSICFNEIPCLLINNSPFPSLLLSSWATSTLLFGSMNFTILVCGNTKWCRSFKTSMEFPQKFKIELLSDPTTPLLGMHPGEVKSPSSRDVCTPMIITALLTKAKIGKQARWLSTYELDK